MTPDDWVTVIRSATPLLQPVLVALVTASLGLAGSYLLYRQAENRRASDERRWSAEKFREETFGTVKQLIEAIAEYDDALAAYQGAANQSSEPLANARERVINADRELNRAKQVVEVFIEHKDLAVAESIRELRRRYETARLAVFAPDSVRTQRFSDIVERKNNIRAEVQDGLVRVLRSYSTD